MTWSITRWLAGTNSPNVSPEQAEQLERWRKLLHYASQTDYYYPSSGLMADAAVRESVAGLRRGLASVEPVPLDQFKRHAAEFRSGYTRTPPSQPVSTLWESRARVALVRPWFAVGYPARVFNRPESLRATADALNRYAPDVIAASPRLLLRLGQAGLCAPQRALVSLHAPGLPTLTTRQRDILWRRFKVPTFAQLRGFQGELLASECDVMKGFHAHRTVAHWEQRDGNLLFTSLVNLRHPVLRLQTGLVGEMETARCGCGSAAPRLYCSQTVALPAESRLFRTGKVLTMAAGS
jgi:hypothetical protein